MTKLSALIAPVLAHPIGEEVGEGAIDVGPDIGVLVVAAAELEGGDYPGPHVVVEDEVDALRLRSILVFPALWR